MIEYTQYITPDGIPYTFDAQVDKFMFSIEGEGMPELDLITQQGPYQHGITILDYRLKPRIVQLLHRRKSCGRGAYWNSRSDLLNVLRPNRQATSSLTLGKLRKMLPGGDLRDLDVFIQNGPRFTARNLDSWEETSIQEAIIFIAPDPTFYNPNIHTVTWTLATQGHLVFPITIIPGGTDFLFGTSIISNSVTITYDGTWKTYPVITITGPLSGPIIENTSTGDRLQFVYDVPTGGTLTVGLQYGNKYVVDGSGNNLIGTLSEDSDLATFHIAPDPEVAGGVNVISVTGIYATGATAVALTYYTRYIGI